MYTTHKTIGVFLLSVLLTACSLNIPYEDKAADPEAITDAVSAQKALATAYSSYSGWQTMMELSAMSDDVMPAPILPKNIELNGYYRWRTPQLIEFSKQSWESNYKTIMYINAVLERISLFYASSAEKEKLNEIISEGKALKGLCYFQLLQLFSPRYTAENANDSLGLVIKNNVKLEELSRTTLAASADSVRALIMPYVNKNSSPSSSNRWLSSLAARCLAAMVEMWVGNYQKVEQLCKPVIASLSEDTFDEKSYESLWKQTNANDKELLYNIDLESFGEYRFFEKWSSNDGDFLVINENISYKDTDIRREPSVEKYKFPVNYGASYREVLLLHKYNGIRKKNENVKFVSVFRTSDFVFLYTEALVRNGKKEKAVELMNQYLTKRKADLIVDNLSDEKLIEQILLEKQKEFLCEGRRFFDLKRLANKPLKRTLVFDNNANYIQQDDFRWTLPIPASEYRYNKKVTQNKGWEELMPKPQL